MTQASRAPRTRRSAKAETASAATTPESAKAAEITPPKPRAPRRARAAAAPVATAPQPTPSQVVNLRATAGVEEQIAVTAYLMWEKGQPGDADQHWYAAERLIRA